MQWWWVNAPHFCAGLAVQSGRVVEAAPILGWSRGKSWSYVSAYFGRKGYEVQRVG